MLKYVARLTVGALALTLMMANVMAQAEGAPKTDAPKAETTKAGKGNRRMMQGMGAVASVAEKSIGLKGRRGAETTYTLENPVTVNKLTLTKLEDVKGEKWASVYGWPTQGDATSLPAFIVLLADKAPENAEGSVEGVPAMGMLTIESGAGTLKAGDKTIKVEFASRTRIYTQAAAMMEDVKTGDNVILGGKVVQGKLVVNTINIRPAGEMPAKSTGKSWKDSKKAATPAHASEE